MNTLIRLQWFLTTAGGISYEKWRKLKAHEKRNYVKLHPHTSYIPKDKENFISVDFDTFHKCLVKAKNTHKPVSRWCVSEDHTKEDMKNAKMYVTKGGSTVALKDGDIISVCGNNESIEPVESLLKFAIKNGGNKLDCYGKRLYEIYVRNGFEPISWTPFNPKFAPYDYNNSFGREYDIVFFRYNPKAKNVPKYEDFISTVKPYTGDTGYDDAYAKRDSTIDSV